MKKLVTINIKAEVDIPGTFSGQNVWIAKYIRVDSHGNVHIDPPSREAIACSKILSVYTLVCNIEDKGEGL